MRRLLRWFRRRRPKRNNEVTAVWVTLHDRNGIVCTHKIDLEPLIEAGKITLINAQ